MQNQNKLNKRTFSMGKNSKKDNTGNGCGELFSLSPLLSRKIEVRFSAPDLSSQGGLLLMREDEQQNGFIAHLAACIEDTRYQPFVQHSYYEMLQQRIYQIAERSFKEDKQPVRFFRTFMYQAGSWKHPQRVIVKIEVNEKGKNVRYIVTSFKHNNSRFLYQELYCGRGQMELYINEIKTFLDADRMSCYSFAANQFRFFLHAAAYVILLKIKQEVFKDTDLENASMLTVREKVMLTAVHIRVLKTKIKIEFLNNHPYREILEAAFGQWRGAA